VGELRVAVIGVGRIGLAHAENLCRRIRNARLVAVTTSRPDGAGEVRRICGTANVYSDIEALLGAERLDAVVIASSTSAHIDNVEACAAAGAHIFCEKPLALTVADCARAAEATANADVKLMIGHVRQFDSGYIEAKRLIETGAIGRPLVYRGLSGDMNPPPPDFADPAVSGGLILDSMYHDIYLARWLLADEVTRVYGEGEALVDEGVRSVGDVDNAVVSLRFADGAMATLTASRTTRYGHDLRGEVIGEQGAVHIGYFRQTPVRLLDSRGIHHDAPHTTAQRMAGALENELQAFVDCVVDDTVPPVTHRDGSSTLAVAIAATRSIHSARPEEVHIQSD
jgi:predicted dehydrogenase